MKIVIVIPAFNARLSIHNVIRRIPKNLDSRVVVVDDGSVDDTCSLAQEAGATVLRHRKNRGYGAAQKTGFKHALALNPDIVVLLHSDGQQPPELIPKLISPIVSGEADVVSGSRFRGQNPLRLGMPFIRYIGNVLLSLLTSLLTGLRLSETHCGFRAFSSKVLRSIDFDSNSNGFVFDTEILLQLRTRGSRFAEIPFPTVYSKQIKSYVNIVIYGLDILKALINFSIFRKYRI